jgi:hypothetical protein
VIAARIVLLCLVAALATPRPFQSLLPRRKFEGRGILKSDGICVVLVAVVATAIVQVDAVVFALG